MPVNTANYGSNMSNKRNSKAQNDFQNQYNKLVEKTAQRGGKISEDDEYRLNKFQNIDKDQQLAREQEFLRRKEAKIAEKKF